MIERPLPQPGYAARARAAFAAGADGAISDCPPHPSGVIPSLPSDLDGCNLDDVEHVRNDRLRRWQAPPSPTRKAGR